MQSVSVKCISEIGFLHLTGHFYYQNDILLGTEIQWRTELFKSA